MRQTSEGKSKGTDFNDDNSTAAATPRTADNFILCGTITIITFITSEWFYINVFALEAILMVENTDKNYF